MLPKTDANPSAPFLQQPPVRAGAPSAWVPSAWVPSAWVPSAWVPSAWVPVRRSECAGLLQVVRNIISAIMKTATPPRPSTALVI
jgi:hypothetical protein